MQIPIFQIDAFTEKRFRGNPAAVCPLDSWLPDEVLQHIAAENNLSETAFFVAEPEGLRIRWFTPEKEVRLCGHATLASAFVWFGQHRDDRYVEFSSLSGRLKVEREPSGRLTLDFPSRPGERCPVPEALPLALGNHLPVDCYLSTDDMMAVFEEETEIREISPDFNKLKELDVRGLIITAPGINCDFVSRFFAPRFGVNEDPVTGSAHCVLAPYWAGRLGRDTLKAEQLSRRGGKLSCEVNRDRVRISGFATPYLEGRIQVD